MEPFKLYLRSADVTHEQSYHLPAYSTLIAHFDQGSQAFQPLQRECIHQACRPAVAPYSRPLANVKYKQVVPSCDTGQTTGSRQYIAGTAGKLHLGHLPRCAYMQHTLLRRHEAHGGVSVLLSGVALSRFDPLQVRCHTGHRDHADGFPFKMRTPEAL